MDIHYSETIGVWVIEMGYTYSHDYGGTIRVIILSIANLGVAVWLYNQGAQKIALCAGVVVGILLIAHYFEEYRKDW